MITNIETLKEISGVRTTAKCELLEEISGIRTTAQYKPPALSHEAYFCAHCGDCYYECECKLDTDTLDKIASVLMQFWFDISAPNEDVDEAIAKTLKEREPILILLFAGGQTNLTQRQILNCHANFIEENNFSVLSYKFEEWCSKKRDEIARKSGCEFSEALNGWLNELEKEK